MPAGITTATLLFFLLLKKYASHFFKFAAGEPNKKRQLMQ
jgi:hypothetical protein